MNTVPLDELSMQGVALSREELLKLKAKIDNKPKGRRSGLPIQTRLAMVRAYLGTDYTFHRIGKIFGISHVSVRYHILRALKELGEDV